METVDFLVVGSGSGLEVANAAVNQGQSVAVIEKGPLGGTCLNRGCIPSKQLLYHADVLETVERAEEFGIDATVEDVAFAEIVRAVNEDVGADAASIQRGLTASDQHRLLDGEARFVDDRTVEVTGGHDGVRIQAETILIAAGTRPAVPPVDGLQTVEYLTSREALELESPPDHLVIVGGGYVAAELGHFFGTFGSDVTIVGRRPNLLPQADTEVAAAFTERYSERFTVHTGHEAVSVDPAGNGSVTVEARPYEYGPEPGPVDGGERVQVTGDELLVAAGRVPNTDTLNLDATAVQTDDRGFVATDEFLRTDQPGVWALGDIVGEFLLKHSANHEARAVARNIFGEELRPVDYSAMPFAVFASPEVAGVGAREAELRETDREYATNTYRYEDTARGDAMHAEGMVKVLIDLNGEILGCHIVGPEASTLIQEVVVAMKSGSGTVRDIRDAVHIHPALPEVVQRAFSGRFTRPGNEPDSHQHHH